MALNHLLDPALRKEFKSKSRLQEVSIEVSDPLPADGDDASNLEGHNRITDRASNFRVAFDKSEITDVTNFDERKEQQAIQVRQKSVSNYSNDFNSLVPIKLADAQKK